MSTDLELIFSYPNFETFTIKYDENYYLFKINNQTGLLSILTIKSIIGQHRIYTYAITKFRIDIAFSSN